jgi:hypothetical protein
VKGLLVESDGCDGLLAPHMHVHARAGCVLLALKLVSVKFSGFALVLPTFSFVFWASLVMLWCRVDSMTYLEILLLFLLLFRTGPHDDRTREYRL